MKMYTKEYGWVRVKFLTALKAKLYCQTSHTWKDLGDPCYCGSDNCFKCEGCGFETHD